MTYAEVEDVEEAAKYESVDRLQRDVIITAAREGYAPLPVACARCLWTARAAGDTPQESARALRSALLAHIEEAHRR